MDFVLPGYLGDQQAFESRYEDDPSGAALMLRRLVANVATDLPERIEAPQALLLNDAEIDEYDHIRKEIAEEYGAAATFVSLGRLRMYCTHPLLLEDQGHRQTDPCLFSKYLRLTEILEEIFSQSDKVLVFTSWNRMNCQVLIDRIFGQPPGGCSHSPIADTKGKLFHFAVRTNTLNVFSRPAAISRITLTLTLIFTSTKRNAHLVYTLAPDPV